MAFLTFDVWESGFETASVAQEQVTVIGKAVRRMPNNITLQALLDNATRHHEASRFANAVDGFRRAVNAHPENALAHYGMGRALMALSRNGVAESCFREAVRLDPELAEAHYHLGEALLAQDKIAKSHTCFREATQLAPDNPTYWQRRADALQNAAPRRDNEVVKRNLIECLSHDRLDHRFLTRIAVGLLKALPEFGHLLDATEDDLMAGLSDGSVADTLEDPLLLLLLEKAVITDPEVEILLTELRRGLLRLAVNGECPPNLNLFLCALAQQCFLTEYIYFQTEDESRWLAGIEEIIAQETAMPWTLIALLAAYKPLYQTTFTSTLWDQPSLSGEACFDQLMTTQVREPLTEFEIRGLIPQFGEIVDADSLRVRSQYEENPYPRWTTIGRHDSRPLDAVLRWLFPHLETAHLKGGQSLEILIAGCGTGLEAFQTANRYADAHILAVDLSATSLSYAVRKQNALGEHNIEFVQADILDLGSLDRRFDLIQSTGVLHHMRDPVEGWRVLTDLLKIPGYMRIGLYSQIARHYVIAAQEFIAKFGYKPTIESIRQCRHDMLECGDPHLKEITWDGDFYSASECRDLLFHALEHRFTLLQIADALRDLELEFLGFELSDPEIKNSYRAQMPGDPTASSLHNWHEFEQGNPETFRGMYQFWVRNQ